MPARELDPCLIAAALVARAASVARALVFAFAVQDLPPAVEVALHASHEVVVVVAAAAAASIVVKRELLVLAGVLGLVLGRPYKVPSIDKVLDEVVDDRTIQRQTNVGPSHARVLGAIN
jgi:hypothetical protein